MKPLSRNIASLSGAELLSRILAFAAVAYLARRLGPDSMGILAVGVAVLAYASIFADAGLPLVGTRQVAGQGRAPRLFVKRVLATRMMLALGVVVISSAIIYFLVPDATQRNVAAVYLISLLPSALLLDWLFQGLGRMVTLSLGKIIAMATYLTIVVVLVPDKTRLMLVPVGWIAGISVHALFLRRAYRRLSDSIRAGQTINNDRVQLIRTGIPLGLANLIAQVVIQFPFLYLGFTVSTQDAGLYSVAYRGVVLMLIFDRVFYTIFFPYIRKSFTRGLEQVRHRFDQILRVVVTVGFYLGILAILAADSVFPAVFGTEFSESSLIFQLLIAYFVLSLVNSVFTFTLIAAENELAYTRSLGAGALGFFGVLLIPLPVDPMLQVPVALTVFQAVALTFMLRKIREIMPIPLFRPVFLPILVSIILVGLFSAWQHQAPVIAPVLALLVSLPLLGWSAGIRRKDLVDLRKALI